MRKPARLDGEADLDFQSVWRYLLPGTQSPGDCCQAQRRRERPERRGEVEVLEWRQREARTQKCQRRERPTCRMPRRQRSKGTEESCEKQKARRAGMGKVVKCRWQKQREGGKEELGKAMQMVGSGKKEKGVRGGSGRERERRWAGQTVPEVGPGHSRGKQGVHTKWEEVSGHLGEAGPTMEGRDQRWLILNLGQGVPKGEQEPLLESASS